VHDAFLFVIRIAVVTRLFSKNEQTRNDGIVEVISTVSVVKTFGADRGVK